MIQGKKWPVIRAKTDIHMGIHNRFDIEVRDAVTGMLRQKAEAFNVVLNQYFEGRSEEAFGQIWYGTGFGTPAETDTGLFAYSGKKATSVDSYSLSNPTGIAWCRRKIVFSETEAVGVVISEVGLGGSSKLYTHAMLQDMNGNPITIQKTNTDIITIYATVYLHWNTDGFADGHIFITRDGTRSISTGWTISQLGILAGKTMAQSGTASARIAVGDDNVTGGMVSLTGTANGIGFVLYFDGEYPIVGEPVGTGDGVATDFALDFDLPHDATVYVDGVAAESGVTVYPAIVGNIIRHFKPIAIGSTPNNLVYSIDQACYGQYSGYQRNEVWLYNPFYERGLSTITPYSSGGLYISNDLVNWISIGSSGTYNIPAAYRYYPYFRILKSGYSGSITAATIYSDNGKAIHFDEPPAAGAVITADYITPCVPKDVNHVLDWSVTITFGRYEGET